MNFIFLLLGNESMKKPNLSPNSIEKHLRTFSKNFFLQILCVCQYSSSTLDVYYILHTFDIS